MNVAVLGVGLIGGSIGMATRGRAGAHVTGYDPDERALAAALELGAIDETAPSVSEAVADADFAFVATPVGAIAECALAALAAAPPDCVLSDVGSTKRAILSAVADERFVGGHPMAGAESAGVEQARPELFDGATWYLTPSVTPLVGEQPRHASGERESEAGSSLQRLSDLIAVLGAYPAPIDAGAHDRLMARLSHLPHVLANVLLSGAARALEREQRGLDGGLLGAGPSFRDATRVAGANTAIWVDIYLSNSHALLEAIDEAIEGLGEVRATLAHADRSALAAWNESARCERQRMMNAAPAPGS
ncbi:MAG: prephenate dehydrogenase [Solirubrobacteraceae bacterium]